MKLKMFFLAVLLSTTAEAATTFPSVETTADIQKTIRFLTSTKITYTATAGDLNGLILPLSYYSTPTYWGDYVCKLPKHDCWVNDHYDANNYTLTPTLESPGADLQVERVNVTNGTDIYDASTWQIALALADRAGISGSLYSTANNQNKLLQVGYDGNAASAKEGANRAATSGDVFLYNGQAITKPNQAYFYRMVTKNWLSTDPFMGTIYQGYLNTTNLPKDNKDYVAGKITWLDWKPITGENAWAFLLGSLQTEQIHFQAFPGTQNYVPYQSIAVQNALNILDTFQVMQSPIGAVYYITAGSLGNTGPVSPYEVSVENNASTLAGLLVLQNVLLQEQKYDSAANKSNIQDALTKIHVMIYGGKSPNGYTTKGILRFFKEYAWDTKNGIFLQGGLANEPGKPEWQPTVEPKAVDVSTWGVAVLGQPKLDEWYGFGTAYKIWENIKAWGGYYGPDKELWGVGYSNNDNNGVNGDYSKGILSAEWSAGAINMTRALIVQYQAVQNSTNYTKEQKDQATQFITSLQKDQQTMWTHLISLRTDRYPSETAFAQTRPQNYTAVVPMNNDELGFMYASKRYMIPFGWYANPLPSITSTAWSVMLHYNFNPFTVDGSYNANKFE